MKYIVAGTNRPGSSTLAVSKIIQSIYKELGEEVEIIDLGHVPMMASGTAINYGGPHPEPLRKYVDKIDSASGLIMVCPEYNGSYPGILKLFIDHWSYPRSFERRPVCYVGLGGRFGGLRPVEHLQQVFNYRNAHNFAERVFLMAIHATLKDGQLMDPVAMSLLKQQAANFQKFVQALNDAKLTPTP